MEPTTISDQEVIERFRRIFFKHWLVRRKTWLGTHIVKYPTDLFIYQMLIYKHRPDIIIETGAYWGGSALFFSSMCDLVGHGEVISVDIRARTDRPQHPRLTYIIGRSTGYDTLLKLDEKVAGRTGMVFLDSDHRAFHVKRELARYQKYVGLGQYLVVEDTTIDGHDLGFEGYIGPKEAVDWFLARVKNFKHVPDADRVLGLSQNAEGYLQRIS